MTAADESNCAPSTSALIGIYRTRNAHHVHAVIESARAAGWETALWALDEAHDQLADVTVGVGHGAKLQLLNQVVSRAGIGKGWVVVSDDDVSFTRGDVVELVALCGRADLDLAQPARSDDNSRYEFNVAHPITLARRLSRARRTTFVEVGPVFVVGPRWWDRLIPLPEERGMGWAVSLDWYGLHERGCRLGIVDAVHVVHHGEPGADYDFEAQVTRIHGELEDRGLAGWSAVQRTLEFWRPWQRFPPWSRA
jgi:hypothetical protein